MLLPHGYEGQGPEHSSARVERFLQTCAEDCLQIVNCTTPVQFFHVLRRQMLRNYRAPLAIFTPKSLLRHPKATSRVEEFSQGAFQELIDDPVARANPAAVRRLVLCTGKVHYDLVTERAKRLGDRIGEVALVRLEQLYPWPEAAIGELLDRYGDTQDVVWCQEEPQNMGPWSFVWPRIQSLLGDPRRLRYAGRDGQSRDRQSANPQGTARALSRGRPRRALRALPRSTWGGPLRPRRQRLDFGSKRRPHAP